MRSQEQAFERTDLPPGRGAPIRDYAEIAALAPPSGTDAAAMADFAGRVADATVRAVAAQLGAIDLKPPAAAPERASSIGLRVLQVAQSAESAAEALMDRSPDRARRACQAGCSFCCHMAVSLTAVEALRVAQGLRATRSPNELRRVRERVASVSARVSGLSIEQRAAARTPCALLGDDGACTIYEFRPLGCRSWTSLDRAACERAFAQDEPGHSGAQDKAGYVAACGVTEGLERGLRAAGLDASQYELHSAVLRALDDERAAERLVAGEPVFSGCARVWSAR